MNNFKQRFHRSAGAAAIAFGLCAGSLIATQASAIAEAPASIFVFDGNNALDEGYVAFGTAAARPVTKSTTFPADLSIYPCVVLPINRTPFTAPQLTAFSNYVNSGGTVLGIGDNNFFSNANANMSALSSALGGGMTIVDGSNAGTSSNIDSNEFTTGVSTFTYNAGSTVTVNSPAVSLVHLAGTGTQPTMLAAAVRGQGVLAISGDSNAFSDSGNNNAYTAADNGKLVANLCAVRTTSTAVLCAPAQETKTTSCTATVTDTRAGGHKNASRGSVTFTTTGNATFGNGGTCALVAGSAGTASCTVSYTPAAGSAGTHTVGASFAGDVRHSASAGRVNAAVSRAPSPTPSTSASSTPTVPPALPKAGAPGGQSPFIPTAALGLLLLPVAVRAALWRRRS